jgi:hypothetical protein
VALVAVACNLFRPTLRQLHILDVCVGAGRLTARVLFSIFFP